MLGWHQRAGVCFVAAVLCAGCAGGAGAPEPAAVPQAGALRPARVLLSKAEGYFFNGRYEEAITAYTEASAQDPKAPAVFRGRAAAYAALRRDAAALADYDLAVALDPRFDEAWLGRALFLYSRGRYADAIDDLDRVIALDPANATAHRYKALACERVGRLREAAVSRKAFVHCDLHRDAHGTREPAEPAREIRALGLPE